MSRDTGGFTPCCQLWDSLPLNRTEICHVRRACISSCKSALSSCISSQDHVQLTTLKRPSTPPDGMDRELGGGTRRILDVVGVDKQTNVMLTSFWYVTHWRKLSFLYVFTFLVLLKREGGRKGQRVRRLCKKMSQNAQEHITTSQRLQKITE